MFLDAGVDEAINMMLRKWAKHIDKIIEGINNLI